MEQIKIDRAQVVVRDATGEIPDTDAKADLVVALDRGRDPVSLSYKGNLNFVADLVYGEVKPNISVKSDFDQHRLGYAVDIIQDDQKACLCGKEGKDFFGECSFCICLLGQADRLLFKKAVQVMHMCYYFLVKNPGPEDQALSSPQRRACYDKCEVN